MTKKIIFSAMAVAGVVAPISCAATSCSSMKYEDFSYKFDSTNKAKDFLPKESIGKVELDEHEVTRTFINKMNENKQILADTIAYGIINDFFYFEGEEGADLFTRAEGTIDVSIGDLNAESSRCTFKYSLNLNVDDENYVLSVDIYNIPFCIYRWMNEAGDESWWCFAPVYTALARPFPTMDPKRKNMVDGYARFIDNWKITLAMSGDIILDKFEREVKIQCIAQETQRLYNFIWYSDCCLVGQSFNKIPYLKDMTIKE